MRFRFFALAVLACGAAACPASGTCGAPACPASGTDDDVSVWLSGRTLAEARVKAAPPPTVQTVVAARTLKATPTEPGPFTNEELTAFPDETPSAPAATSLASGPQYSISPLVEELPEGGPTDNEPRTAAIQSSRFAIAPDLDFSALDETERWGAVIGKRRSRSAIGRVTDYGQKDDPYKDSASLGKGKYSRPTGAWNNALGPTSFAISPDVEAQFAAAGIKPGDPVKLKLSDGSVVVRTWDDRTMQDQDAIARFGKPLRGRFDFFSPKGAHPQRGTAVLGFEQWVRPPGGLASEQQVQAASGSEATAKR